MLAASAAMMVSTSQARPTAIITSTPISTRVRMPPMIMPMITVMLKFSASLPWSATKGMVSFFISHTTSGPSRVPKGTIKPTSVLR
ncbi:hypothetical protein D3C71_2010980 [compost metagenome]